MDTIKKIEITRLTENFVELIAKKFVEIDGKRIKLDVPHIATSYTNSEIGRQRLQENEPKNIVTAIMAMWGDMPTVKPTQPTEE